MENSFLKNLLKKLKLNESAISTILGAVVIIVIGALVFNYFKGINKSPLTTGNSEKEEIQKPIETIEENGKVYPQGLPTIHKVTKNENLWKIAERYYGSGYNWVSIAKENKIANPNKILVGQEINIPKAEIIKPPAAKDSIYGQAISGNQYSVEKGDNLWKIAVRAYADGYQWVKIAQANNLANPDIINPGQNLVIPR